MTRRSARLLVCLLACFGGACGAEAPVTTTPVPEETRSKERAVLKETELFVVAEPMGSEPTGEAPEDAARLLYSHVVASVRDDSVETVVSDVVQNDTEAPLDFTYRFPLPNEATVTGFAHYDDGKRVKAEAKEKDEARESFDEAKRKGETAAMTEEVGSSSFAIRLSPLAPGESRRVELSYVESLDSFGATRSYVFPKEHSLRRGQPVLDFEVVISAEVELDQIESLNHEDARIVSMKPNQARALLQRTGTALSDDFVLRWTEIREAMDFSLSAVAGSEEEPGFGEVSFAFNSDPDALRREARDYVLVVDTSLSMAGPALEQGKHLIERTVKNLSENDRLAFVSFDDALQSSDTLAAVTPELEDAVLAQLAPKRASGFSNVEAAIDRAAELIDGSERPVVLFITDGQSTIGEALDELEPASSKEDFAHAQVFVALTNYPSRQPQFEALFPDATLRFLPSGPAGKATAEAMAALVSAPVLENVELEIEGLSPEQRHGPAPERLALGERVRILGRLDAPVLRAKVSATLHGRPVAFERTLEAAGAESNASTLPRDWARLRMNDLQAEYKQTRAPELRDEMVSLGETYHLVSAHTSLVARDSLSPDRIAPGDPEIRIHAPRSLEAVTATLPWGEKVECRWRADEKVWFGRFLVPRSIPDGLYRVAVETRNQGRAENHTTLLFRVDSKAPRFELDAENTSDGLVLIARPAGDVFDTHGNSIRLDLVDVKALTLRFGGKEFALERSDDREWRTVVPDPKNGSHALELVATDYALNSSRLQATLQIREADVAIEDEVRKFSTGAPSPSTRVNLAPSGDAGSSARCFFESSRRQQRITKANGELVELFEGFLRDDGKRVTPCNGLPAFHPSALAPLGDGYAVGFRSGEVYRTDGASFSKVAGSSSSPVTALATDASGTLWIGTATDGLFRVEDGNAKRFSDEGLPHGRIAALSSSTDALHVALEPRGHFTVTPAAVTRVARSARVGCFRTKADGGVEALRRGLACRDSTRSGTLPSAHVSALAVHGDRLAVASFNGTAYWLDAEGRPQTMPGAPRWINALSSHEGRLWFATASGVFVMNARGEVRRFPLQAGFEHINGLTHASDGTLWLATSNGLLGVSEGGFRQIGEAQGLPSRISYAVTQASDGSLWVATAAGAARIAGDGVTRYTLENGALPQRWVTALLPKSDGTVMAGTYSGGVARLSAAPKANAPLESLGAPWVNPHGLFGTTDGFLVATLGEGLVVFEHSEAKRLGPLPSDDVTAMVTFGGARWVGTRGGLARLPLTATKTRGSGTQSN